jgi:hypothetical protein
MASSDLKRQIPLRWAGIGLAILFFIWLPIEDTNIVLVLSLSAGFCAWIAFWRNRTPMRTGRPPRLLLTGGMYGLAVTPLALILVVVKAGIHAHGFVDFTNEQLILIIKSTPLWVLLGVIGGKIYQTRSSTKD